MLPKTITLCIPKYSLLCYKYFIMIFSNNVKIIPNMLVAILRHGQNAYEILKMIYFS